MAADERVGASRPANAEDETARTRHADGAASQRLYRARMPLAPSPRALLAFVAVTACRHPPVVAASAAPAWDAATLAPDAPVAALADAAVPEAPRALWLGIFDGPLPPDAGVALAATPDASVTLTSTDAPTTRRAIPDGTRVTVREEGYGVGQGDARCEVEVADARGFFPNASVLTEERLHRSADRRWAVFHAVESCGDFCHAQVVLLGASGARRRLCGDEPCEGPEVVVAWRPDGREVAVGGWALRVVSLPSMEPREVPDGFTAPTYGPDGALYARHTGGDDAVYELPRNGTPRRVLGARGHVPGSTGEGAFLAPMPVTFDHTGTVLCATFFRGRSTLPLRAHPDGRPVVGVGRCP